MRAARLTAPQKKTVHPLRMAHSARSGPSDGMEKKDGPSHAGPQRGIQGVFQNKKCGPSQADRPRLRETGRGADRQKKTVHPRRPFSDHFNSALRLGLGQDWCGKMVIQQPEIPSILSTISG